LDLRTAVELRSGELIALVGAGGKTTTAWQLMCQLSGSDEYVVFATTTRIFQPVDLPLILSPDPDPKEIARTLTVSKVLVLAAGRGETGDPNHAARSPYSTDCVKLTGLEPDVLNDLARRLPEVTWLVEADGAKGRMLKAPAEYEPVIPSGADRVIVVAGLGVIGQPLDEGSVHRPEIVANLLGVPMGEVVTPELFVELVGHPEGGLKGIPDDAEVVVLLTRWEEPLHTHADGVAQGLLANGRVGRVALVDLSRSAPVLKVWTEDG
jgi:probable selenium-dependent hydroxylase accessory protein YqeC